ncbi:MAG: flagellar biosynthesis anti-sigma factor FlgM [Pseudomonadota bacterium]
MPIIDSVKSSPNLPIGQTPTPTAKAAEKPTAATPAATDSVQLSSQLQSLEGKNGVFDTKKVEKIKLAIAGGQFQVNSEKVADGLLETVKDLLHSRKR